MGVIHMQKLLVVDDEPELVEILVEYFQGQQYQVTGVLSAEAARLSFKQDVPQLVILDLRMPGEDGLSLARWIRANHPGAGIVMLTTAAEVIDRIIGLEVGADDYIAKPFELRELHARVKSIMRRINGTKAAEVKNTSYCAFGQCQLDIQGRRLLDAEGKELSLTSMEFELLKVFASNPNRALNRDQLMALAHHKEWDVFDRSIDLRIMRLRRKVELDAKKPAVIKTVRGGGYIFVNQ
jgi:DNA-binding response OmpR family regulator